MTTHAQKYFAVGTCSLLLAIPIIYTSWKSSGKTDGEEVSATTPQISQSEDRGEDRTVALDDDRPDSVSKETTGSRSPQGLDSEVIVADTQVTEPSANSSNVESIKEILIADPIHTTARDISVKFRANGLTDADTVIVKAAHFELRNGNWIPSEEAVRQEWADGEETWDTKRIRKMKLKFPKVGGGFVVAAYINGRRSAVLAEPKTLESQALVTMVPSTKKLIVPRLKTVEIDDVDQHLEITIETPPAPGPIKVGMKVLLNGQIVNWDSKGKILRTTDTLIVTTSPLPQFDEFAIGLYLRGKLIGHFSYPKGAQLRMSPIPTN